MAATAYAWTPTDKLGQATAAAKSFIKGASSARYVLDDDGKPYYRADDDDQILSRAFPDSSDTGNANVPMTMVLGSYANATGASNLVARWGLNVKDGGVPIDVTRPSVRHELELDYLFSGVRAAEGHLCHKPNYSGAPDLRPYSFYMRNDAAPSEDGQYNVEFEVRRLLTKWNGQQYMMCDTQGGLRTIDVPIGTAHTSTTADHLLVRGPASMTGRFATFQKNGFEFLRITPYGEFLLDTSTTGSGTSPNAASLDIRGRTGTNSVMLLSARDGTPKVEISATPGQSSSNLIYGGTQLYGAYMSVGPYNASTQNFVVNGTGEIYTNQYSTFNPAGAVIGSIPCNRTGTFDTVGHIKVYAAS